MIQRAIATAQQSNSIVFLSRKCKNLNQLKQIHAHLLKFHLPENCLAIGPVLSVAATSKDASWFAYARSIFEQLSCRNTFVYNTMIRGYVQLNLRVEGVLCYLDMLNCGFVANNYTFPPLMKACTMIVVGSGLNRIGRIVHAHVVEFGFGDDPFILSALIEFYSSIRDVDTAWYLFDKSPQRDVVMWTAMIDGYGKMGDVEEARMLFDEMPERNALSWSAVMAAYSRDSDFKEVLSLFARMQEIGIMPNESVLVTVVTACANLGAVMQGLWVHSYAEQHNFDANPILATALVDMYSKCGCVESALAVFEGISDKDAGAWNAMIFGVAMNGDARRSLELFNKMIENGTQPTHTTFVALLSVCTHTRMVNEGLTLFEQMSTLHRVEPQFEHYACVVDLLARAGRLEEAEKFVLDKMGGYEKADANVWGAMLCACRVYGNIEIGNRIWRKLADMGVTDCGTHVLSYNMYKEAGWEIEAKKVRKLLSQLQTKKKPGCSLIEVNGAMEEFFANNLSHSRGQEIRNILESLSITMKLKMF